jgi:hypothetical protein
MLDLLAQALSQSAPPTMEYLAGAGLGVYVVKTILDSPLINKRKNGAGCLEHSGIVATLAALKDRTDSLTEWMTKISAQLDKALQDKKN